MSPHLVRMLTITARHWSLPWRASWLLRARATRAPLRAVRGVDAPRRGARTIVV